MRKTQTRQFATAASPTETETIELPHRGRSQSDYSPIYYKIKAGVLLSRPPLLTRNLTPFEKAYYVYQRRLNERLALPFTRYFYYQKGTPGDVEWKRKIKGRLTPARDIGRYSGYGKDAWNDELLAGEAISEPQAQMEALLNDAEDNEEGRSATGRRRDAAIERPLSRLTQADVAANLRSLNRSLARTLYLVVKRRSKTKQVRWMIPQCDVEDRESLQTVR